MKKVLQKFLKPNSIIALMFCIFSILVIAGTISLLVLGYQNNIFIYILYFVSALVTSYMVYIIIHFAPKMKKLLINLLNRHNFTKEFLINYGYRSVIFLIFSFVFNVAFAIFQGVIAIISKSVWYGALAAYYIALSLIRGGIIALSRKKEVSEFKQIKSYRNAGIYLVLLNFALVSAIIQMVLSNQGFVYAGVMIYVMAAYTFYKLIMSVYNLFKAKEFNNHTIQSIRNISFADALVSILGLQTALLQEFSNGMEHKLANSLTGAAVSIIIIGIGIAMIIKGNKKLKLQKEEIING